MAEMDHSTHKHLSDPVRIGWAVEDLERFVAASEQQLSHGRHMSPDEALTLQRTASFLVEAFRTGVVIPRSEVDDEIADKDEKVKTYSTAFENSRVELNRAAGLLDDIYDPGNGGNLTVAIEIINRVAETDPLQANPQT